MPGPGAAGLRIFHDHLRMVVINLATENPLGGVNDGFAAREHAVDGVTGVVPKGKADNIAAAVVPSERVVVKGFVLLGGTPKQVDFLRIEHVTNERVAFLPVFSESIWSDGAAGHKRSSHLEFLTVRKLTQGRFAAVFGVKLTRSQSRDFRRSERIMSCGHAAADRAGEGRSGHGRVVAYLRVHHRRNNDGTSAQRFPDKPFCLLSARKR